METLLKIVQTINAYLSDYVLIILLVGAGLYFTVRTRFVQVRYLGEGLKRMFGGISFRGKDVKGGISSFQALTAAVAAQVGTGNIVGACGAILIGGPGAIFWMWIIAFLGMATIYAEAVLAQKTRIKDENGNIAGGPVYYIKKAFTGKFGTFLAGFFAIACMLALGFMGSMVQSNSIASTCSTAFGIPTWVIGLFVAVIAAFVFLGGVKRLTSVTEKLVPIMAVLYLVGSLVILALNYRVLPQTIGMIFQYAFVPQALAGGAFGATIKAAISQGAKRGLFSNEAGMGSTPHAHALAEVKRPHEQGVVAMAGVFIDTFVVLTMTALVVISSLYTEGGILASGPVAGVDKNNMAQIAFGQVLGSSLGSIFIAVCLFFFAFSTILSWNLFGKINANYLFNQKGGNKITVAYTLIALAFIFLGSLLKSDLVWELADFFNYLMVLPNVIALFALGKVVAGEAKEERAEKIKN